ncbi:MAG: metallophosphoesterase [Sphingomonadales bacterium]|nr:metallophosphoesterase [Sphingomonadales bacterium]
MLSRLRTLIRPFTAEPTPPALMPPGTRAYAVGDIHGRSDLFEALAEAIEHDNAARAKADSTVILLGDLVDRGPDSLGVLHIAREWQKFRPVRILLGNHEEMMLAAFDKLEALKHFDRAGGRETLISFGIDAAAYDAAEWTELHDLAKAAITPDIRKFVRGFEDQVRLGDYLFVHAGILPGVEFDRQKGGDMRWIREPFLSHTGSHGAVVVHGHTIMEAPELRANRIGIDTGAYASGVLTALGLEGGDRWLITARADANGITTSTTPA